ncbi:cytochrome c oxidase assembly protein [Nocardia stercoris]|uniref:Cytochrome c oxidase assembly protein n=1 Tax=Nocardia stercoris TaxID=2483361 RepID=A0A3M2KUZ6_9NOCA|nr:cytochrome c oxidase assembly protein [Nocardia stercoris]RMI28486.1 cytochrome c oxidase assembly protein [Nocardia stercoris]
MFPVVETTESKDGEFGVVFLRSPGPRWVYLAAGFGALALLAVVVSADGGLPYRVAGLDSPGTAATLTYVMLRAIAAVAGALALGATVYTVCCTAVTRGGRVEVDGYSGLRAAQLAGGVWAVAALALVPVSAADAAGMPVARALSSGAVLPLIEAGERPKAWLVTAVLAGVFAVAVRFVLSWLGAVTLAGIAVIAVLPAELVGNAGEGPGHDYATGAMIGFQAAVAIVPGLLGSVAAQLRRGRGGPDEAALVAMRRGTTIAGLCLVTAVVAGAILAVVLLPPTAVARTTYGRLALVLLAIGVGVAVLVWRAVVALRGRAYGRIEPLLRGAAATAAFGSVVLVAMAVLPAPAFADQSFTAQQVSLGFDLPGPISVSRVITFWRFDIVLGTAALAGLVLYLFGVSRLRRRGDDWPWHRTVAWASGCAVLLITTSSGVGAYGYALFSVHMVTHMLLTMGVPVLLVLGAPMTLLLRAVPPAGRDRIHGPREWVLALLHSRPAAFLAHPVTALTAFVLSLYGLYFTPLYETLIRFHWGHLLMNVHFLVVGYLYYWGIIGIDPGPRRLPHLGRLGIMFAVMPFHAFFGIAVMSMDTVIGDRFYAQLDLPWHVDRLSDQHMGGGIAWVSGEFPILLVVGALLAQWIGQERRTAVRTDRKADDFGDTDLDAYNEMLRQLAQSRR